MKRKPSTKQLELGKMYRAIVLWDIRTCEMCPTPAGNYYGLEVHHIYGRSLRWQYDVRAAIALCRGCHSHYDHAMFLLLKDMRKPHLWKKHRAQAVWLNEHKNDPLLQKAWYDEQEVERSLKEMLFRLRAGETREDVRDWSE